LPLDAALHHDPATLWAPRRQLTLAQARLRSGRLRYLRHGLVGAAAVSIGLFLGFVFRSGLSQDARPPSVQDEEAVTMINPRFTGRDSEGQIFTITADAAQRRRAEDGVVDLVNPIMRDGKGAELRAPTGYYDRHKGVLELYEAVNITDSAGYSFVSRGARMILAEDRVEGLSPLEGKGPLGDIRADSYEILDGGNRIVFEGNVQTVIYPQPAEEPATSEGEQDGTP
jgi:lipopolysaccharide export system protein LptC